MIDKDFSEKSGLKTAVADEIREGHDVPGSNAGIEQPLLLPLRQSSEEIAAENDVSHGVGLGRGPGRPKGAKNKNTEEWRNYLLSRYTSPLIALAETYSRPVHELAHDLGFAVDAGVEKRTGAKERRSLSREDKRQNKVERRVNKENRRISPHLRRVTPEQLLELFKVQLQCAKELAPYVHQKQPMAIETGDSGLMQLIINTGSASANQVDDAGVMDLDFIDVETAENSQSDDENLDNSVACNSVACDKSLKNCGFQCDKASDTVSDDQDDKGDD